MTHSVLIVPMALAATLLAACGGPTEQPAAKREAAATAPAAPPVPTTPPPVSPTPLDASVDAKVAGTDFHATASIPCALSPDQPMSSCQAGVVRNTDGSALVTVFWPGGGSRTLRFGPDQSVSVTEAGAAKLQTTRSGDLTRITLGAERYDIPDALPFGG